MTKEFLKENDNISRVVLTVYYDVARHAAYAQSDEQKSSVVGSCEVRGAEVHSNPEKPWRESGKAPSRGPGKCPQMSGAKMHLSLR